MNKKPKYYVHVRYRGFSETLDRVLEKLLNREPSGSGFGGGMRDIDFDFFKRDAAERAIKKLKKFKSARLFASLRPYEGAYKQ